LRFLDMFSGIGGFHLGMSRAGHECAGAVEIDPHARAVYAHHWPDTPLWGDATKLAAADLPPFDVLCGGFPCQPFSVAGKGLGIDDARGTLFFDVARLARDARPRHIVLENVPGLLAHAATFGRLLQILDECGYDAGWQVLHGECWLPQARHRLWLVACLRGSGAREVLPVGWTGQGDTGRRRGKATAAQRVGPGTLGDDAANPTGLHAVPFSATHAGSHGQHVRDGPSFTMTTVREDSCVAVADPGIPAGKAGTLMAVRAALKSGEMRVRRLTPLEAERVQGFPDGWTDVEGVPESARYRLVGNAVMPPVVEFLGRML